jgi:hypothetical protein
MAVAIEEFFGRLGLKIDKKSWSEGNKLVKNLKVAVAGFVGFKGLQAIRGMIQGVADKADAAAKTAQKLGLTTEAVQELGYAAELSGTSMDSLGTAIKHLVKQGGVKDVDAALMQLADRFAKMPDGPAKTALAIDKFGRSGMDLIPLLNSGSVGLAEMRAEAHKLGIVISGDTAKKFEQFNDDQTRLKRTWEGIKITVVTALLPALQRMVNGMREWITANREIISTAVTGIVKGLSLAFTALATVIEAVMPVLVNVFEFLTSGSEEAQAALIGIAVAVASVVVPALYSMAKAWLVALGPITLIIAAVAGIVLLVRRLARTQVFRSMLSLLKAGFEKVKSIVRAVWSGIQSIGRGVADTARWVWDKLVSAWRAVTDAIDEAIEAAMRFAGQGDRASARVVRRQMGRAEERNRQNDSAQDAQRIREVEAWQEGRGPKPAWMKDNTPRVPRIPLASGGGAVDNSTQTMHNTINVTVPAGADGQDIAVRIRKEFEDAFSKIGHSRGVKR